MQDGAALDAQAFRHFGPVLAWCWSLRFHFDVALMSTATVFRLPIVPAAPALILVAPRGCQPLHGAARERTAFGQHPCSEDNPS